MIRWEVGARKVEGPTASVDSRPAVNGASAVSQDTAHGPGILKTIQKDIFRTTPLNTTPQKQIREAHFCDELASR